MSHPNITCGCSAECAPGMIQGMMQSFHQVYPAQTALRNGTLFPELHKPMSCAPAPTGCAEATARQEASFAAWEVRLYLNTHPGDANARMLFERLCQQAQQPNYACAFVPCGQSAWKWIDDPWPWEICANERRA